METAPESINPSTIVLGVAVVAGGLFLIWYANRPAPAAPILEKVAETIKATAAQAEKVIESVTETVLPQ